MYGRVEYKGKSYYSYVFGYFEIDYMPHYVVYNNIDDKFEIVANFSSNYNGHRQIGLMSENENEFVRVNELTFNFCNARKCAGYPWLILNTDLINDIHRGNPVDLEYVKIAKTLNQTIDPDKYNEVLTKEDAQNFMNHVGGFHDWYLVSINAISNPYSSEFEHKVELRFSSQGPFDCIMQFDGAYINYNFCQYNRIYLSTVLVERDLFIWVDGEEDLTVDEINQYSYVQGNHLRWKFVLKEEHDW